MSKIIQVFFKDAVFLAGRAVSQCESMDMHALRQSGNQAVSPNDRLVESIVLEGEFVKIQPRKRADQPNSTPCPVLVPFSNIKCMDLSPVAPTAKEKPVK